MLPSFGTHHIYGKIRNQEDLENVVWSSTNMWLFPYVTLHYVGKKRHPKSSHFLDILESCAKMPFLRAHFQFQQNNSW